MLPVFIKERPSDESASIRPLTRTGLYIVREPNTNTRELVYVHYKVCLEQHNVKNIV